MLRIDLKQVKVIPQELSGLGKLPKDGMRHVEFNAHIVTALKLLVCCIQ